MGQFGDKFQEFMRGRNGLDEASKACYGFAVILYLLSFLTGITMLYTFAVMLLFYGIFRVFSTNVSAREAENDKLLEMMHFQQQKKEQGKEYKIFKCKGCGRKIRVPRGKGKIEVKCPVCGQKEIKRT